MNVESVIGVIAALPWVLQLPVWALRRGRPTPLGLWPAGNTTGVSVIIPMRNEAENVNGCLSAIFASQPAPEQVIVVDDESTDGTAELLRAWALLEPQLVVLNGRPLPSGWFGKPWALTQAAEIATGPRLLFVDADVRLAPQAIGRAESYMLETKVALLSLEPRQILGTVSEHLIMPVIFTLIALRYPNLSRMNNSTLVRNGAANGQFIMVDRESYERVGGHGAVRGEVVEDIRLAHAFRRMGEQTHIIDGREFVRTRMYTSLSGMIEGWSKNLAIGSRQSMDGSPIAGLVPWIVAAACFGAWTLPALVLLAGPFGAVSPTVMAWAWLAVMGNVVFWGASAIMQRSGIRWCLTHPIGAMAVTALVLNSLRLRSGVAWRGRSYPLK